MGAKEQAQKLVEIQIPFEDKGYGDIQGMHPDLQFMTARFSETVANIVFQVEYTLEVYVKHKSKLELGVGSCLKFPIKVSSMGQVLPFLQTRMEDWQRDQSVPTWEPNYVAPVVYCGQIKDDHGNYSSVTSQDPDELKTKASSSVNIGAQMATATAVMALQKHVAAAETDDHEVVIDAAEVIETEEEINAREQAEKAEKAEQLKAKKEEDLRRRAEEKAERVRIEAEEKEKREEEERAAMEAEAIAEKVREEIVEAAGLAATHESDAFENEGFF